MNTYTLVLDNGRISKVLGTKIEADNDAEAMEIAKANGFNVRCIEYGTIWVF